MPNDLLIGITEGGILHTDADPPLDLETKFRMAKETGVYDYLEKTPPADQVADYAKWAEKYDLPVLAGGWFYKLGRDEALLEQNLRIGGELGSVVHNTQILMDHADGHLVTDQEVAEAYLRAQDIGAKVGCQPTFEVHVNMWSEDFRRVMPVAELVSKHGIPFRMTLDHSHVMFKIDNPREQAVLGIDAAIASGDLVLDPFTEGNICQQWIDAGIVGHMHARAAAPNNPRNIWAHHESLDDVPSSQHPRDTVGRGIQYPFLEPKPGEWHSPWNEAQLEPWKEVVRRALAHHATTEASPLRTLSTEFIPGTDYGAGAKYSIFDHSVACARWVREVWGKALDSGEGPA